jgi:hypothetical protein
MQIINPGSSIGTGVIQATYRMASTEGFLSLWRGMSSVIVGAGECLRRDLCLLGGCWD